MNTFIKSNPDVFSSDPVVILCNGDCDEPWVAELQAAAQQEGSGVTKIDENSEMSITCFRGAYSFLGNEYALPFTFDGRQYENLEAAFQAHKCADESDRAYFCSLSAKQAKYTGRRRIQLRPDWEAVKESIMYALVFAKFASNPHLLRKLLATGNKYLVQGTEKDFFWGVPINDPNGGRNVMGNVLMRVRDELAGSELQNIR